MIVDRYEPMDLFALVPALGMRFEPEYLQALRRTAAAGPRRRHEVAREAESIGAEREWNQDFVYVAGYTEAGVPFGVTGEEFETLSEGDRRR